MRLSSSMSRSIGGLAAVALGLIALTPRAEAAACLVTDVTLTITGPAINPTSCANNVNAANNSATSVQNAVAAAFGQTWAELARDSNSLTSNTVSGIKFELDAAVGQVNGSYTLKWTDVAGGLTLPIILDLTVYMKGGSRDAAAYLFEDLVLPVAPNQGTGTFAITFLNNGGNTPALSYMSVLGSNLSAYNGGPNPIPAPEPASLALFGAALAGLGLMRRRKTG